MEIIIVTFFHSESTSHTCGCLGTYEKLALIYVASANGSCSLVTPTYTHHKQTNKIIIITIIIKILSIIILLLVIEIDLLGSSITDVIDRAGVKDKLDLLLPLTANMDLLRLLFFLEGSTIEQTHDNMV